MDTNSKKIKAEVGAQSNRVNEKLGEIFEAIEESQKAIEQQTSDSLNAAEVIKELQEGFGTLSQMGTEIDYMKQMISANVEHSNAIQQRTEGLDAMIRYVSESSAAGEKAALKAVDNLQD